MSANQSVASPQEQDTTPSTPDLDEIARSGSQRDRALNGLLYGGGYEDPEMSRAFIRGRILMERYNATSVTEPQERRRLLKALLGSMAGDCYIEPPFRVDYGCNIHIGRDFYANTDCTLLDCARITIGDHVFVGPQVGMYTPTHPIDSEMRNTHIELAKPITIGDDVWIGGHTTICPGVTIGSDVVIGAGSVVTHDIPDHSIAVGNPCRVLRAITDEERGEWKRMAQEYFDQMAALGIERGKRADQAGADFARELAERGEEAVLGLAPRGSEAGQTLAHAGATGGTQGEASDERNTSSDASKTSGAHEEENSNSAPHAIPMRRSRQELPREEVETLLASHVATSGVLALNDPQTGVPYQVPLSYVYVPAPEATGAVIGSAEDAAASEESRTSETNTPLGTLYFHGSLRGHKMDLIRAATGLADGATPPTEKNATVGTLAGASAPRASFCVTLADDVVPETFSTRYRSIIATGRIEEVANEQERRHALMQLGLAYAGTLPNPEQATQHEIEKSGPSTCVLALRIETLTGKEAKSLATERRQHLAEEKVQ